jgi:REP element-mobilizing transposase RayT
MPQKSTPPRRRSLRLPDYDYTAPGFYFVTICTQGRKCLFGAIEGEDMHANDLGHIVETCWRELPDHFPRVLLDAFVLMPNHVHGVLILDDTPVTGARNQGLSQIVGAFKSFSSRRVNESRHTIGRPLWQRSYFERVIRTDKALTRIRDYIVSNPLRWALDHDNPHNLNDSLQKRL